MSARQSSALAQRIAINSGTWRARILSKQGNRCFVCGISTYPPDKARLKMDWITPPQAFLDIHGKIDDADACFRDDNCLLLCDDCWKVRRRDDLNIWTKGHIFIYNDSVFTGIQRKNREIAKLGPKLTTLRRVVGDMAEDMNTSPYAFGPSGVLVELMADKDVTDFLKFAGELKGMEDKTRADAEALYVKGQASIAAVIKARGWERAEDLCAMIFKTAPAPPPAPPAKAPFKPNPVQLAHIASGRVVPFSSCRLPETDAQFALLDALKCVMSDGGGCDSPVPDTCPRCGGTYCPKHFAGHKR